MDTSLGTIVILSFVVFSIVFTTYFMIKRGIFYELFSSERMTSQKSKEKIFFHLDNKFSQNLIEDEYDIEMVKSSIERESGDLYSISSLLEDYLLHLSDLDSKNTFDEKSHEKYKFVKKIIIKENEEKPFSKVPEEERRLLISLKESIEKNDTKSSKYNIEELSNLITVRKRIHLRTQRVNKLAIPLAIFGLVASLIFGLMNIANKVDYRKIESLMKNSTQTQIENPY